MKVSVSRSKGNKAPNFCIYAETQEDRVLLEMFIEVFEANTHRLQIGGATYELGIGIRAFNFGLVETSNSSWPSVNTSTSKNVRELHESSWSKKFKKILGL